MSEFVRVILGVAVPMLTCALGYGDEFSDHPVARVEKTPSGNVVLRHTTWLIHLDPEDFRAFSNHVGRYVRRSLVGYKENEADDPPEPIRPGDVFSTPGIRLIEVMPDPQMTMSVRLDKSQYGTDEPIAVEISLLNNGGKDARIDTALSTDPNFKATSRVVVFVHNLRKWVKPRFYVLRQSTERTITLEARESCFMTVDISKHIDGPGTYRVSSSFESSSTVFAPYQEFTVSRNKSDAGDRK